MELSSWPVLENISARLVELVVQLAEIVVYRRGSEHSHALPFAFHCLEPERLNHNAEALDEENAAENGHQQLLMYYHCTNTNDTTDCERTGVAHEYLCRIGVIPKETYHRTDERTEENHKFLRPRNIHYIKI